MAFEIKILRRAQKELAQIKGDDYDRIKAAILALSTNPRPHGCKQLSGREGWRIRVGNYRIIYEINDKILVVLVIHIGHGGNVYRLI